MGNERQSLPSPSLSFPLDQDSDVIKRTRPKGERSFLPKKREKSDIFAVFVHNCQHDTESTPLGFGKFLIKIYSYSIPSSANSNLGFYFFEGK